ncbi:MAG TPA: ROK family transcriptional regulator [Vicinamibacteria bacterium]|nr:ROK family transcriptional regulator [Vicinamibacteria bacterium]
MKKRVGSGKSAVSGGASTEPRTDSEQNRPLRRGAPTSIRLARRGTSRQINRQIAFTLIRTRQPISRADLARLMGTTRGAVTVLVNDLITGGLVFEGAKGEAPRGRKPKFLYLDSRRRCVVAVDLRPTRCFLMVTDIVGEPLVGITSFPTDRDPDRLVAMLAARIRDTLERHPELGRCEGVGVVVPGMVDRAGSRVLFAPRLGWHDVPFQEPLSAAVGLPVVIENAGKACALAQAWSTREHPAPPGGLVFLSVSDGLGVGVVTNGQLIRGQHNAGGEFAHMPLSLDGPRCACGVRGCWEAHVSNLATVSRYLGRELGPGKPIPSELAALTVEDLVARARHGDGLATAALEATARDLGAGLAGVVNAVDPARIYVSGEITAAWDMIEPIVRAALDERTLVPIRGQAQIVVVPHQQLPRLRGAAALVTTPAFATPVVA